MILAIDIDGVLRDFIGQLNIIYNTVHPEHTIHKINSWDLHKRYPIGKKVYNYIWDKWAYSVLGKAKPYDGAKDFLLYLKEQGHYIILASTQPTAKAKHATMNWLYSTDILDIVDTVILLDLNYSKGNIQADVLLDDSPNNLREFLQFSSDRYAVCYDRPWNKDWTGLKIGTYDEFKRWLDGIHKD